MSALRLGIDVGGTFTDAVCVDADRSLTDVKVLTTYPDPAGGVLDAIKALAALSGESVERFASRVETVVHGTTVITNALLTGRLARTGLLATAGFRDSLEMRKGYRESMYDNRQTAPAPLVPRSLRLPVLERMSCAGEVFHAVDDDLLSEALSRLAVAEVEAVAVCLLHSYANDSNEQHVAARVRKALGPEVYVCTSAELLGRIGFYERTSTTCINAAAGPLLSRYLTSLERRLKEIGFRGTLRIMQSGGGMVSLSLARQQACNSLLSGPAAGVVAAQRHAAAHGFVHALSMDMGGTSFDICAIESSEPLITTEASVGSHRVATPMVDIRTIGAGGGSIAWVDSGGLLRVGPQSAGSTPGPACYGRGGTLPTVTDANLLLGYLDPAQFWGGRLELDRDAAEAAVRREIAEPLGLSVVEAAYGIFRVVSVNMTAAARQVTVERGNDPREYVLILGGGAGPVHASVLLSELGAAAVLIPDMSAVLSAGGMLMADIASALIRTMTVRLADADPGEITRAALEMRAHAAELLEDDDGEIALAYSMDLRYAGQLHELEVPISEDELAGPYEGVAERFHALHGAQHGYAVPEESVELINLRLRASMPSQWSEASAVGEPRQATAPVPVATREAYLDPTHGVEQVPVHLGASLTAGEVVEGPALLTLSNSAVVVDRDLRLEALEQGGFMLQANERAANL